MGITRLPLSDFMALSHHHPVLDVRSPAEYQHAHIPSAISFPLFTDEERKIVGTAYKQESKQKAIKWGLQFFGTQMASMVEAAEDIIAQHLLVNKEVSPTGKHKILVHCWRGGMRSAGVAWLLDLYGFEVYTLAGGYKVYRNWVLQQFNLAYSFRMLGGCTGSGKTHLIHLLQKQGSAAIDLEGIASHKGSAFGNLGMPPQPSQEMFENILATELHKHSQSTTPTPIWLEDESQRIGNLNIPGPIFTQMRSSPLYFLEIPFEERLQHIMRDYGLFSQDLLIATIARIQKRLGGLETKLAIQHVRDNQLADCFRILLKYYDKYYLGSLHNLRPATAAHIIPVSIEKVDVENNYRVLLSAV
ncbi:MAG: tRNA 2-selenouridine(34) synthase MnmH, partial [Bacteroidetes bacterium]|nr:tRNA 2-selenouridine(34) synthase MnmH [Bacteroidota bacterium]